MALSTLAPSPDVALAPPWNDPAAAVAASNLAANLGALSRTQPRFVASIGDMPAGMRPVYARDGSLTALTPEGKWWHGCSVPLRAAEAILSSLDVKGRVACLLRPALAAHVRVALRRSRHDQAILAVCPDVSDLRVLLGCDDFSAEIGSNQLWFVWGDGWAEELKALFAERPGLATPAQFIRLPTTPAEEIDPLIPAAQAVFGEVNTARTLDLARRRDSWRPPGTGRPRLCVVAPSHFRLWHDGGAVLAETLLAEAAGLGGADVVVFDPDDPACSAAPALLRAAEHCSAIVAAGTSRRDIPGVIPAGMAWVTWVTRAAMIPPYSMGERADALVLADAAWRADAAAAGWPAERVAVGGWPAVRRDADDAEPVPQVLGVVADTRPIAPPAVLEEFSSHQLLWNHIAAEVAADPFAVGDKPGDYLERRMKRHGVAADGFDAGLFLERLILPAYEQGLVRTLVDAGLPVRLFGNGWDQIAEFRGLAEGPVTSPLALGRVSRAVGVVIDVSPVAGANPLHRLGRTVVGAAGLNRQRLVAAASRALAGADGRVSVSEPLGLRQVIALLGDA